MVRAENLWGEEFSLEEDYEVAKKILGKIKNPNKIKELTPDKILHSKSISFEEKLRVTKDEVYRILGKYMADTICIYSKDELHRYIDKAIENNIISIDTETIGTRTDIKKPGTDPFTVKLGGPCIYTPGMKQAYIPINHVDYKTNIRLSNQLTEQDIKEEFQRIVDHKVLTVWQNGKFDYMVFFFTCGIKIPMYWDTMIASQLLNENELAGLKFQYRDKIDPTQEKYDIDSLFDLDQTEKYPPEIFAPYAATDPYITYKLYEWQKEQFEKPGNEKFYKLFLEVEMPIVEVTSEMEIRGFEVDKELAKRLSVKFHRKADELDNRIAIELSKYDEQIKAWRLTPEANNKPTVNGRVQKSLSEKLSDPVELTSPTQLGILFYDVLKVLKLGKDGKKITDEATLLEIRDKIPLAGMILDKREYEKYLGTYIDVLPTYCSPRDGRLHSSFHQLGRESNSVTTGRMSSSNPNMQNIPARGNITSVRCMFVATTDYPEIEEKDNCFEVPIENEVMLSTGEYRWSSEIKAGDILENGLRVNNINIIDNIVYLSTEEVA